MIDSCMGGTWRFEEEWCYNAERKVIIIGQSVFVEPEQVTDNLNTQTEDAEESLRDRVAPILREAFEILVLAVVIWVAVNFTTARSVVNGSSMEPNLQHGQYLLVNRLSYLWGSPQRGDIIVFHFPGNPDDNFVKRVIGLPGDQILMENNQVFVNGERLDESYLSEARRLDYRSYSVTVAEDSYFVLGDNRLSSHDSRSWGFLRPELIVGKAWFSYWPVSKVGVRVHYEYDQVE